LGIANDGMERFEQVGALVVAVGLAVVSYQLFSPARQDLRPSQQQIAPLPLEGTHVKN
jgi:hypothetical protein